MNSKKWLSFALPAVFLALPLLACGDDSTNNPGAGGAGGQGGQGGAVTAAGGDNSGGGGESPNLEQAVRAASWLTVDAAPSVANGKQDDIFFLDRDHGFLASGPQQAVFETTDGGDSWSEVLNNPQSYFRAVLFTDAQTGFVGNIGAGLSPSITDDNVMYRTSDGGSTWAPVTTITGDTPSGICNFDAVDQDVLVAVGRANAPAHLLISSDGGDNWVSKDLSPWFMMAIDAHFVSATEGVITGMGLNSEAAVLRTTDGGATFQSVLASTKSGSLGWKLDFPSPSVGYLAIQDTATGPGTFGKTLDGGATWQELPLPVGEAYGAIGIGFVNEDIGWVVSDNPSAPVFVTYDGGANWEMESNLKGPINRFRLVGQDTVYAVGASLWKLELSL